MVGMQDAALGWPQTPLVASCGGSIGAQRRWCVRIRPSTVKRHLVDLRARTGLTTEQLIYVGRATGWLVVQSLERS